MQPPGFGWEVFKTKWRLIVGIKERQKVARLIEEEFHARRREASKRPEDHEVVERH